MPGPPIRKPSDHSPPAGSPRNIAGHHVLHRPLMPRHPPNAQKNKQQTRQNTQTTKPACHNHRNNTVIMLASTIQFTTNPPTPTTPPHNSEAEPQARQPGRTTPEPRQHATPHTNKTREGHPPPADHHDHNSRNGPPPQRACFLHQTTRGNQPPRTTAQDNQPPPPQEQPPSRPRPINSPDNHNQEATPTQYLSLERR